MYLTKTDYIHYLRCGKSLWLLKHKPDVYPHKEFSKFLQNIVRQGYVVERYAQQLFPTGQTLPTGSTGVEKTKEAIRNEIPVLFQATFHTDTGLFARLDVLERLKDGTYAIYEVKSSNSIKRDAGHNHVIDACFQKIAAEQSGLQVSAVYIIHINGDYLRGGDIDPTKLLKKVSITGEVENNGEEVSVQVAMALKLLEENSLDEVGCGCYRKTQSNHCDAFTYFNGALPEHSIWGLGGIREKKLNMLLERGVTELAKIPDDISVNETQIRQIHSAVEKRPIVDEERIAVLLNSLQFPLYFFDYETASSAIPLATGMRPWQHMPFQFSLHILQSDGELKHVEHLSDTLTGSETMLKTLSSAIGTSGSVISWYASFEKSKNRELALLYPEYKEFLEDINARMFDLMVVFKKAYIDAEFLGSLSIKKVLPVICPHLSYAELDVRDGGEAMEQWFALLEESNPVQRENIRRALLAYCALDTFAMVELYRTLATRVRDI